jgi:hypothetical protein
MHEEIQKSGANARALGLSELDNPYYKQENMPAKTGEPIAEWQVKAEAWTLGWRIEDAIRSAR